MSIAEFLVRSLYLTVLFEGITLIGRFGFGLTSRETLSFIGKFTFNFRIHHGYVGLVLLFLSFFFVEYIPFINWVLATWVGLVLSDVAHHFFVLLPLTGSHQFDIFYDG